MPLWLDKHGLYKTSRSSCWSLIYDVKKHKYQRLSLLKEKQHTHLHPFAKLQFVSYEFLNMFYGCLTGNSNKILLQRLKDENSKSLCNRKCQWRKDSSSSLVISISLSLIGWKLILNHGGKSWMTEDSGKYLSVINRVATDLTSK